MEQERLIELVQSYRFLYDLSHSKYNDVAKKERAWKEISDVLNQPASECKQKWQSLRDSFRRFLKKRRTKTGIASTRKWKYEDEMEFLVPYFCERKSTSIVHVSSEDCSDQDSQDNIPLTRLTSTVPKKEERASSEENYKEYVVKTDTFFTSTVNRENKAGTKATRPKTVTRQPIVKKKFINNKPSQTLSSAIAKFLMEQKQEKKQDEIDRFFLSMAATIKKFTPYNQAIAKAKVFSLISDMEFQCLDQPDTD